MYSIYVLNKIKKHILHQNYLGTLKHSKQKSIENFPILFSVQCTGCMVRWSAEISRRLENIEALLQIVKNEHQSNGALALKG